MSEAECFGCFGDADVHVIVETEEHGVLVEEFWCPECLEQYKKEQAAR